MMREVPPQRELPIDHTILRYNASLQSPRSHPDQAFVGYGLLSLTAVLNGAQLIGTNRGQNLGGRSLFVLTAAIVVPADIVPVARVDAPPPGACSTLDVTCRRTL